ncbi:hypothetical protein [Tessaracoccus defluvii]|uniref:Uncharacterized protein n=1 Tax=Tessaracoccus defluvii TaxID=1285901 RepID=A0A7H0H281_9ACTN|nr:hypothetical protein [Tessaracoccus defluvii]QNP54647.1 hypothetical protein H9L22_09955 [Tessaracoccus defluvii]
MHNVDLGPILDDLAAGRIDAREAANRIEAAKAAAGVDAASTQADESADTTRREAPRPEACPASP